MSERIAQVDQYRTAGGVVFSIGKVQLETFKVDAAADAEACSVRRGILRLADGHLVSPAEVVACADPYTLGKQEVDAEVEVVDAPFSPEEPPGSWQDARVAAMPMALMAARIRFKAVIMMEPPLLSVRPHRPEEYRDSMQHSSFEKRGESHGEKLCGTHDAHGQSRVPEYSPCSDGEYPGSDGE